MPNREKPHKKTTKTIEMSLQCKSSQKYDKLVVKPIDWLEYTNPPVNLMTMPTTTKALTNNQTESIHETTEHVLNSP